MLPQKSGYVIKFLVITAKDTNEVEKRTARFKKEIQKVLLLQNEVDSIVPMYDTSLYCEEKQDFLWYLMPKAEKYNPRSFSVPQKLKHMLCLGPQAIRPPELQPVEKIDGIDYRKSDVYLFAKTVWMVLHCNNRGFSSEYSRTADDIYIDKEIFEFETAEPLHRLMEEATKHNYWERIDIGDCINYIENQLRVIKGDVRQDLLRELKYSEEAKRIDATVPSDEKIFRDSAAILKILNNMSGVVELVFLEIEKEYCRCPLRQTRHIQDNLFEVEIHNPYNGGKRKIIILAIDNICLKKDKDMIYEIQLNTYCMDDKSIPIFTNIINALENLSKRVCLNAGYLIRMVH